MNDMSTIEDSQDHIQAMTIENATWQDFREQYDNNDFSLLRNGPFAAPGFDPSEDTLEFLHEDCKVLVVGAGGLGCELLKNLAVAGFTDIHVIDMDVIELSNLNRQFLFAESDIGKSKAEVAARKVNERVRGVNIVPHFCMLEDKDSSFYQEFNIVISGLDSVSARRWLNAKLVSLVEYDADGNILQDTAIPLIDGGSEGFMGHVRIILPKITSCYECTLALIPSAVTYPLCTIANTPRQPEHCIEYVTHVLWPKCYQNEALDADNETHMEWVYDRAVKRADAFGIEKVTMELCKGVVKNIIPAIASTNSIIAAACALEAFKLATAVAPHLKDFTLVNGNEGTYTFTYENMKDPECPICGLKMRKFSVESGATLANFREMLAEEPYRLSSPSLRTEATTLYMCNLAVLEKASRPNLSRTMGELVKEGEIVYVTDSSLPVGISLEVHYID